MARECNLSLRSTGSSQQSLLNADSMTSPHDRDGSLLPIATPQSLGLPQEQQEENETASTPVEPLGCFSTQPMTPHEGLETRMRALGVHKLRSPYSGKLNPPQYI